MSVSTITEGHKVNSTYVKYAVIFLAGVVLASKVKTLPVLNKLPSV
jgi:hypothetical protein